MLGLSYSLQIERAGQARVKKEFDVYFSGEILEGYEIDQVKQAVGELFRLSGPKLEALFAGIPVRVKKNLSVEKAGRFRKVFLESGALVQIVPAGQEPPSEPAAPVPPRASATRTTRNSRGSGLELAPMEPLETESNTKKPAIDTSSLSLDDSSGVEQQPPAAREAPLPDISHLSMAAPDEGKKEETDKGTQAPLPDISHLEAAPPDSGSLEDCATEKPAAPLPDISGLSLED